MRPVIFALVVVLVVSHSEALRCHCRGRRTCSEGVETCKGPGHVCASIIFTEPALSFYQSCYPSDECELLRESPVSRAICCGTDLCN